MARGCLEPLSMKARHEQMTRSHYNAKNEYSAKHKDAKSNGDEYGKGTGDGGHVHWLPDCGDYNGQSKFTYKDFNTLKGGNKTDVCMRNQSLTRSLYSSKKPYGQIDTSKNISEGQYVFGDVSRMKWSSPCK